MRRAQLFLSLYLLGSILVPATVIGMPPPPVFQNKSIKELLPLLDSSNASTRENAASGIGWRLEQDKFALTNIEPALVQTTLLKTSTLFKQEENHLVRLAYIAIFLDLDAWTNTSPILIQAAEDKDYFVRVRAITALFYVSRNHREQLSTNTLSHLEECLKFSTDSEVLWQAAFIAGESGSKQLIPSLNNLLQNSNGKVRQYASEAIKNITK